MRFNPATCKPQADNLLSLRSCKPQADNLLSLPTVCIEAFAGLGPRPSGCGYQGFCGPSTTSSITCWHTRFRLPDAGPVSSSYMLFPPCFSVSSVPLW